MLPSNETRRYLLAMQHATYCSAIARERGALSDLQQAERAWVVAQETLEAATYVATQQERTLTHGNV